MHISGQVTLVSFAASAQAIAFPQFGGWNSWGSWNQQTKPTSVINVPATGPTGIPVPSKGGFQFPSARPSPGGARGGQGGFPGFPSANPVASAKPAPSAHPAPPAGNNPTTGGCPAVWTQVAQALTSLFLTSGQCNDDARAAIRAVFHDCFPDGGCDGSLALAAELSRPENTPMTATVNKLSALANQFGVGVADIIAFAGCE
jgi:Peroxidase